jgi:type IV pilus assembly protein PilV
MGRGEITTREMPSRQSGVGMLEFLIALLIFSTGLMGLLATQLVGKQTGYEAIQRSIAVALARDMLTRIQANRRRSLDYVAVGIGQPGGRLPLPAVNCNQSACSPAELAGFDLWEWESLLLGSSEKYVDRSAGGLLAPCAEIVKENAEVTVVIGWWGVGAGMSAEGADCKTYFEGVENDAEVKENVMSADRRSQLQLSTYVGV